MSTEPSLQTLAGMLVSHVWFSDYSICYLELGSLSPRRSRPNGSAGNAVGEVTVFLGYDWGVERAGVALSRIELHKHENERDALVASMLGAPILTASLAEPGMEMKIGLSTGVIITTASSEGEDPDWNVVFRRFRNGWLHIQGGRLQFNIGKP